MYLPKINNFEQLLLVFIIPFYVRWKCCIIGCYGSDRLALWSVSVILHLQLIESVCTLLWVLIWLQNLKSQINLRFLSLETYRHVKNGSNQLSNPFSFTSVFTEQMRTTFSSSFCVKYFKLNSWNSSKHIFVVCWLSVSAFTLTWRKNCILHPVNVWNTSEFFFHDGLPHRQRSSILYITVL